MELALIYKFIESLLEQANIDIERDMWRWTDEDDEIACSPSGEVKDGLAEAFLLFFDTLSVSTQQEIVTSIRKFAYKPTLAHLLAWQNGELLESQATS